MVPMPACSCARPSGNFPEPRPLGHAAGSRARALVHWLALALLGACSREAHAVRLPSDPGTEVYRISCRSEIGPCREKASAVCSGEYQVLENSGAPIEPPRVSSAPGPRSTGSRFQRPDWVGELIVACGAPPAQPQTHENAVVAPPAQAAAPAPLPDQLCIPGVTQLCLGPAACRGAQACLVDGRGYGPCDCGPSPKSDAGTTVTP
jgi:hypothetical protein